MASALGSGLLLGIMAALIRLGATDTPIGQIAFSRGLIVFLLLAPIGLGSRRRIRAVISRNMALLLLLGTVSMLCFFWTVGVAGVGAGKSLGLLAHPLVAVWAYVALGEVLSRREVVGIGLTLAGAFQVVLPDTGPPAQVAVVGIAGAVAAAGAYLQLRTVAQEVPSTTVTAMLALGLILGSTAVPGGKWFLPNAPQATLLVAVGATGAGGQLLLSESFRHLRASVATTLSLSSLVFGVSIEALVLTRAPPSGGPLLGYTGLLVGLILIASKKAPVGHSR